MRIRQFKSRKKRYVSILKSDKLWCQVLVPTPSVIVIVLPHSEAERDGQGWACWQHRTLQLCALLFAGNLSELLVSSSRRLQIYQFADDRQNNRLCVFQIHQMICELQVINDDVRKMSNAGCRKLLL